MAESTSTDRRSIEQVLVRYANGLDRCDFDAVRSCFHDDATALYSNEVELEGAQAIADYVKVVESFESTLHHVGNIEVEVHGDEARTMCRAVAYLVRRQPDGSCELAMRALTYIDRFLMRNGAWRIAERHHQASWECVLPVRMLELIDPHRNI
jgi:ketosteroid isomerase-like protein